MAAYSKAAKNGRAMSAAKWRGTRRKKLKDSSESNADYFS